MTLAIRHKSLRSILYLGDMYLWDPSPSDVYLWDPQLLIRDACNSSRSLRMVLSPSDEYLWDPSASDLWDPTAYMSRVPVGQFSISI